MTDEESDSEDVVLMRYIRKRIRLDRRLLKTLTKRRQERKIREEIESKIESQKTTADGSMEEQSRDELRGTNRDMDELRLQGELMIEREKEPVGTAAPPARVTSEDPDTGCMQSSQLVT